MQPESHKSPSSRAAGAQERAGEVYPCDAFERRLHQLLDARAAPEDDDALCQEATASTERRALLRGQQLLLEGLELAETPDLPGDFAEQCVAAALTQATAPAKKSPRGAVAGRDGQVWRVAVYCALCAAGLLLAAMPVWSWLTNDAQAPVVVDDRPQPEPDFLPAAKKEIVPPAAIAQNRRPAASPSEGEVPEFSPEKDAAPQQGPPPLGPQRIGPQPLGPQLRPDLIAMLRELGENIPNPDGAKEPLELDLKWMDEVALGLRPVATSVGEAFNVLRSNIPPGKHPPVDDPQAQHFTRGAVIWS